MSWGDDLWDAIPSIDEHISTKITNTEKFLKYSSEINKAIVEFSKSLKKCNKIIAPSISKKGQMDLSEFEKHSYWLFLHFYGKTVDNISETLNQLTEKFTNITNGLTVLLAEFSNDRKKTLSDLDKQSKNINSLKSSFNMAKRSLKVKTLELEVLEKDLDSMDKSDVNKYNKAHAFYTDKHKGVEKAKVAYEKALSKLKNTSNQYYCHLLPNSLTRLQESNDRINDQFSQALNDRNKEQNFIVDEIEKLFKKLEVDLEQTVKTIEDEKSFINANRSDNFRPTEEFVVLIENDLEKSEENIYNSSLKSSKKNKSESNNNSKQNVNKSHSLYGKSKNQEKHKKKKEAKTVAESIDSPMKIEPKSIKNLSNETEDASTTLNNPTNVIYDSVDTISYGFNSPNTPSPNKQLKNLNESDESPLSILFDFNAQEEGELSVKENDLVRIQERDDGSGWTLVTNVFTNDTGYVPTSYIQF